MGGGDGEAGAGFGCHLCKSDILKDSFRLLSCQFVLQMTVMLLDKLLQGPSRAPSPQGGQTSWNEGRAPEVVFSNSGFLTLLGHFSSASPMPCLSWKFLKDFSRTLATFTGSIWGQKHMYFVLSKPFIHLGTLGHTQTREMHAGHHLKKISQYLISLP